MRKVLMGSAFLVALTAWALPVRAQDGVASGRIIAADTREPLPNVQVSVRGTNRHAITRADGRYRIDGIRPGRATLVVTSIGYVERWREIELQAGGNVTVDFELNVSAVTLDQVVVTGTIVPTTRKELVTPISVITSKEIARQSVNTIGDLLRGQVPGVISPNNGQNADDYGAGRGIYIRGGTELADASANEVKIYLDGIEVADYRQINSIDPNQIERIEILRGPQASTLYGSGALSGVIQIFTKKGMIGQRPSAELYVGGGSIEKNWSSELSPYFDTRLVASGGLDFLSWNVGGTYNFTGDWTPDYFVESRSGYGGVGMRRGPLTANATLRYNDRASRVGLNPFVREKIITGEYVHTPAGVAPYNNRFSQKSKTYGASFEYRPFGWWRHSLTLGRDVSDLDGGRAEPTYYSPNDSTGNNFVNGYTRDTYAYNSAIDVRLSSAVTANLVAGGDRWMWSNARSTQEDTTRRENRGYFAQAQLGLWSSLYLIGGLRAEDNDNFGDDVGLVYSPRVGVSYVRDLSPRLQAKLRASYGEATRPPTEGQKAHNFITPTQEHIANLDLRPEYQEGGDIGLELFYDSRFSFEVTYYDQTVYDLISEAYVSEVPDPFYRIRQHQNMGDVQNDGWEFRAIADYGKLQLDVSWSFMDSHVLAIDTLYRGALTVGERLHGVARNTGGVTLAYVIPGTYVGLSMTHVGTSRQYDSRAYELANRDRLRTTTINRDDYLIDDFPAVTRFNLTASRELNSHVGLQLRVDNLLDQYRNDVDTEYPTRGRQMTLGARMRY